MYSDYFSMTADPRSFRVRRTCPAATDPQMEVLVGEGQAGCLRMDEDAEDAEASAELLRLSSREQKLLQSGEVGGGSSTGGGGGGGSHTDTSPSFQIKRLPRMMFPSSSSSFSFRLSIIFVLFSCRMSPCCKWRLKSDSPSPWGRVTVWLQRGFRRFN